MAAPRPTWTGIGRPARRRLIAAARALEEHGTVPPGVHEPELYRQRSGGVILPREVNWWDATEGRRSESITVRSA